MQNNNESNSIEDIQLTQENFNNNKAKFCNDLLTTICKKMIFAQVKAITIWMGIKKSTHRMSMYSKI